MKTHLKTNLSTAFAATLVCASIFFSPPILAGANHDHGDDHGHSHAAEAINQDSAKQSATKIISALIKKNKIDSSWANITASSAEKKEFDGRMEWVVVFNNDKIADSNKQKLYIFLTLNGDYIAANHTGN